MSELRTRLQEHIPALRRYARALVGDAAQADDLVQDCLERAVSRAHQWRQSGSLRGWLFTIMHNINANQRRSAARAPAWDPIERAENSVGRAGDQIDRLMLQEVVAALGGLSLEQRQVLLLVALEGLRYEEVAQVLGVPIGTVMSRLSRARDRLRDLAQSGGKRGLWRVK
ncbi:MAG: RNA polymerase sigma factor [Reyranellaceae bacterium]